MTVAERNNKLKHFITCLKCEVSGKPCDDNCSIQYDAGNMGEIIENLEAISKALKQEPCEDCISREEVVDAIADTIVYGESLGYGLAEEIVSEIPSVKPQVKTGRWIELGCVGNDNYNFECSECHHTDTQSKAVKVNYCWYCGAKMIEPQESEKINCKATKCEHCTNHNYCDYEPQEKRCADCDHYGKLSLDCGRCDDDCSMFEPKKSEG